jgi:hypothetical protein
LVGEARARSKRLWVALLIVAAGIGATYWAIGIPSDGWTRFSEQDFLQDCDVALGPPDGNGDIFCGCLLDELQERGVTAEEAADESEGFGAGVSAGFSCGVRASSDLIGREAGAQSAT